MVDMPDNDKSVSTTYYPLLLLNRVLLVKKNILSTGTVVVSHKSAEGV